ncbi:protein WVD2-like 5 isoform X1 [Gossypium australe]|uniref:Protein WVD2-like 5 isoform X1 n=1 Tax=Gossypium australe TaxID=47621 RepID=A0A5B6UJ72_9ROSI|nr:protein WVD2-like 5 isoform X1 [Gossypium australe]
MDSDNLFSAGGLEVAHQNGVYPQLRVSGDDNGILNNVNGNAEETVGTCSQNGIDDNGATMETRVRSNDLADNNGPIGSKEGEVNDHVNVKQSKPQKVQSKTKNEKPSGTRNASSALMKKSKDGKTAEVRLTASNGGSVATNSHLKQPLKNRSCNERQANASKGSEKPDAAFSEGPMEKPKLKPLKKGPLNKAEGDTESSYPFCPMAADAKPRKVGSLPNYGFSFKCDERAEKRKEFYTKLEEKIQAMEVEKSNLQAKSKETQEAEIKMFRKSLNFKATPMPSFYQEPPPPKVELKKIPPTRAKSPKLGRRKSSTPSDSDGNSNSGHQSVQLSLDEKAFQSTSSKVISPVNAKKPQRKSLPKLPSQKTSLSGSTNDEKTSNTSSQKRVNAPKASTKGKIALPKATNEENNTLSDVTNEELSPTQLQPAVSAADSGESQRDIDQVDLVQELIALEH